MSTDKIMRETVQVLGSGKIVFAGLDSAVLERSELRVINITRNNLLAGINSCAIECDCCKFQYQIYAAFQEETLSETYESMEKNNVRVGVISCNDELFIELIKNGDGGIWFSACREGLFKTYLPVMEKYITKPTYIFVFDNDENIVQKARELCHNSNIKIFKCIVHSVCSEIRYDYSEGTMYLTCGKECLLVFPPDAPDFLRDLFKTNPVFGRAEFKYTTSNEAFHFFSVWKPLGINAMHTLASVKAYVIGSKQGLSLAEVSRKKFSDLIQKEDLLTYVIKVYSQLFDKHLAPYAEAIPAHKDTYVLITESFINGLYDMNETIGRGLDPLHSSYDSKLEQHFPLLQSSEDEETINLLNEFLSISQSTIC